MRYIMEEFIHAEVNSYDAIIDSHGEPMFETGNVTPFSIMDIVNDNDNSIYYIVRDLADDVRAAGRATVKSFGVRSRFIHFEFFRLTQDQPGMGQKGDMVALEVNMRPCGGFSPRHDELRQQHRRLQDLGGHDRLRPFRPAFGPALFLRLCRPA